MSLLSLVQVFCRRTGLPVPLTVMGSAETITLQIMALFEEECNELAPRQNWADLTNQCEFLSLATESQGTLQSLGSGPTLTNGLNFVIRGTFWDRTQMLPVLGPYNSQEWQAVKAVNVTAPQYAFRLLAQPMGNDSAQLLLNPVPPAGHLFAFEYMSRNWCLQFPPSGVWTPSDLFISDEDNILLPHNIVLMGLRWRWKKEKGLPYAQDFDSYEGMVADAGTRDGVKRVLHMDNCDFAPRPGIWVPSGSWPVS